jgi:hypothetical protein
MKFSEYIKKKVFTDRIISAGSWPPGLPNLSVCNFNFWRNLNGKVYRNISCTAEVPQNETKDMAALILVTSGELPFHFTFCFLELPQHIILSPRKRGGGF